MKLNYFQKQTESWNNSKKLTNYKLNSKKRKKNLMKLLNKKMKQFRIWKTSIMTKIIMKKANK